MNKTLHISAKCGKSWPDVFGDYTIRIRFERLKQDSVQVVINKSEPRINLLTFTRTV